MRLNTPTISIIVPVYNAKPYLSRCITSILNQTFEDYELLLINDGSTDESGNICDKFALMDDRIKVYHQENRGVSSARNVGLKEAKGEWIGFVDSDDWCDKHMFEKMYRETVFHKVDMAVCGYRKVSETKQNNIHKKVEDKTTILNSLQAIRATFIKFQLAYSPCNKLYKISIIKDNNIIFDKNISFGEDLLFLYEVLKKSKNIVVISDVMYNYFRHQNSTISEKNPRKRASGLMVYKKILKDTKGLEISRAVEDNLLYYRVSLVIFCRFNSKIRHRKYSNSIKKEVLKQIFRVLFGENLSVKQKIITISIFFPKIFLFALKIKKRVDG